MTTPDLSSELELARLRHATLGDFEILAELGRGGMAVVYLAHDIALDRKVALKLISPAIASSAEAVTRFKREARTAASLSHPNIIPIFAVKEADGLLYFVMKLIDGRPLDSIMRELGPLPQPMIQAILGQVAGAFGHAHRHGVVHRDIKPGNIIVDNEGWCVVTDFGIAKVTSNDGLTTTGTMVGTPTYMSPEQCLGFEITGASDQYALGVVAYEMITGRVPFGGTTMMPVMYAHVNTQPPPIETLRPDCPPALAEAVMRMLAKDPANRFPSIEEAVAAIGPLPNAIDDPTRSQLITLAKSGVARPTDLRSTPRSPLPRVQTPAPVSYPGMGTPAPTNAVPASRSPIVAIGLVGAAAIVAAAIYFRPTAPVPETSSVPAISSAPSPAPVPTAPAPPASPAAGSTPTAPAGTRATAPSAALATVATKDAKAKSPAGNPAAAPSASAAPIAPVGSGPPPVGVLEVESDAPVAPAEAPSGASALTGAGLRGADVAPAVRSGIERAIRSYGQALVSGDLAAAQRVYPAMPEARRNEYEQQFTVGLRHSVHWRVGAITSAGKRFTVKLAGTTAELKPGTAPYTRPVDEEVVLERLTGDSYIIVRTAQ